jgi:hypothetical protein
MNVSTPRVHKEEPEGFRTCLFQNTPVNKLSWFLNSQILTIGLASRYCGFPALPSENGQVNCFLTFLW